VPAGQPQPQPTGPLPNLINDPIAMATSAAGGRAHAAGEDVVPTFVLRQEPGSDAAWAGRGDVVTVADDSGGPREEHWITWDASTSTSSNDGWTDTLLGSRMSPNVPILAGFRSEVATGTIVALEANVSRPFLQTSNARVTKWPTGQLPRPHAMAIGAPSVANAIEKPFKNGLIDELIVSQEMAIDGENGQILDARDLKRLQDYELNPANPTISYALKPGDKAFPAGALFPGIRDLWRSGRLLRISDVDATKNGVFAPDKDGRPIPDEIVGCVEAYSNQQTSTIAKLVRGAIGTTQQDHTGEALLWVLPWPKTSALDAGFAPPRDTVLAMRPRPDGRGALEFKEHDGYIALDRGDVGADKRFEKAYVEALPYRRRQGAQLVRPRDSFDRGCFRASFGTDVANPPPGGEDLVVDLPFRAHDRWNPRVDSIEGVFFEAERELPGSYFYDVKWWATDDPRSPAWKHVDAPGGTWIPDFSGSGRFRNPFLSVMVAARIDQRVGWDAETVPPDQDGELPPGITDKLYLFTDPTKKNLLLLAGHELQLRLYTTFKHGAFENDGWKSVPIVDAIWARYRKPVRVLRREEMPQ
jgi:hypothetical protein